MIFSRKRCAKKPESVNVGKVTVTVHLENGPSRELTYIGRNDGDFLMPADFIVEAVVNNWGCSNLVKVGNKYIPMHLVKSIVISDMTGHWVTV